MVVHLAEIADERGDQASFGSVVWRTLVSGDRTPTERITAGVAVVPASPLMRLHRHDAAELYYVIRGDGEVWVAGSCHDVTAGSAVFIPADAWHGARATGADPMEILYAFAVDSFTQVAYEHLRTTPEKAPDKPRVRRRREGTQHAR